MKKYIISPGAATMRVATRNPPYKRKDKGSFLLGECTLRDLKYLKEVIGITEITTIEEDERTTVDKATRSDE